MAGWVDGYMQAKFRGVVFYVRDAGYKTGRRKAKFQYPGVDRTDYEDLGKDEQSYTLNAYIIGDDYFEQRRKLEEALDKGGVGTLVHPYRGVLRVSVDDYSSSETETEGRLARYSITFVVEEEKQLTEIAVNTKKKVLEAKANIAAVAKDDFVENYTFKDKMLKALSYARETLSKAGDAVERAKGVAATQAEYKRKLDSFKGKIIALSLNSEFLFDTFFDMSDYGTNPASGLEYGAWEFNAREQIREQQRIIEFSNTSAVDAPDSIVRIPASPAYQIQQMMKFCAIASEVGLIASANFGSVDDAYEMQSVIFDDIDAALESDGLSDAMFIALTDARGAVFEDVERRMVTLPKLTTREIEAPSDVLSLCYHIYGDLDLEQDFIDRNAIVHPGFIPVGIPLQFKAVGNG